MPLCRGRQRLTAARHGRALLLGRRGGTHARDTARTHRAPRGAARRRRLCVVPPLPADERLPSVQEHP
eukprot:1119956-Rhodomonas_salina.1